MCPPHSPPLSRAGRRQSGTCRCRSDNRFPSLQTAQCAHGLDCGVEEGICSSEGGGGTLLPGLSVSEPGPTALRHSLAHTIHCLFGQWQAKATARQRRRLRTCRWCVLCCAVLCCAVVTCCAQEEFLHGLGKARSRIIADGNCLFRAVSAHLYGTQALHAHVRRACVAYLNKHRDTFAPVWLKVTVLFDRSYDCWHSL